MSMTAGDDKQQKRDEGSNKEGGKGSGNGERVAGEQRAMATMVKKRVMAARAMVMRVVDDKEEGGGDGGNMVRNNDNGLVPVIVQQAILYLASASLKDESDNESTK